MKKEAKWTPKLKACLCINWHCSRKTHDLRLFLAKPVKKLQKHSETRFTLIQFKINSLNITLNKTETKDFKNLSGHFLIKISLKLIQPIHQLS